MIKIKINPAKNIKTKFFFKGYDFLGAPDNLHGQPDSSYATEE